MIRRRGDKMNKKRIKIIKEILKEIQEIKNSCFEMNVSYIEYLLHDVSIELYTMRQILELKDD